MAEEVLKRYVCRECGAVIVPTGRMGAPCNGCGRSGTGRRVSEEKPVLSLSEAGRLGGEKVRDAGLVDFVEIGRRGGEKTAGRYGPEHYSAIGRLGGKATSSKYGRGHYREIGAIGGARVRELLAKGLAAEA